MMDWARLLAYITGTVDQELLLRNEYLAKENRILKAQLKGRLLLCDAERASLAEIGHRLGRRALEDVATAAKPDTILGWYRETRAKRGLSGLLHVWIPSFERFAELIVQGLGPDLQQKVSPPIRPAHLLLLHEPLTDHLVEVLSDLYRTASHLLVSHQ